MTEKFKSRDVKKQLADVKREFQKLEAPKGLKTLKPCINKAEKAATSSMRI